MVSKVKIWISLFLFPQMTVVDHSNKGIFEQFPMVPRWTEYVNGGFLKEPEAKELDSLSVNPLAMDDARFQTLSTVLGKQVSQEVTRYIVDAFRNAESLKCSDPELVKTLINAIYHVIERFEGSPIHVDALFAMSRVVRENAALSSESADIFFTVCRHALQTLSPELCIEALAALAIVIEEPKLRLLFASNDRLMDVLMRALQKFPNQPQLHYNAILCFWLVSFDGESVRMILQKWTSIVPLTVSICRSTTKDKVIRMGVGLWRNLLEMEKNVVLPVLIGSRALEFITNCVKKNFTDPDLSVDLHHVLEELERAITKLTTFDEYANEVKSGILDWTPPHKSILFWKDNASRLHENHGELLKYSQLLIIL